VPGISFDQPLFLLGLLLLPLLWWAGTSRRSLADLDPLRRTVALVLRLVIVACVVLALSGVHLVRPSGANCTLFVIDASYSMSREDRQRALEYVNQATRGMRDRDRVGVITVGSDARLAFAPAEKGQVVADITVPDGSQTNLARGVNVALSYFPEDAARRIVLISDGNETAGSVAEAARSAKADDVPVDVIALGKRPDRETLIERMLTPPTAKKGEPFPVRIVADSLNGGTGKLKLFKNGKYVGERAVTLKPGKNVLTLPEKSDEAGFLTYEARLEMPGEQDTVPENNRAVSFVRVQGRPKVLLVRSGDPAADALDRYLPQALRAQNVDVDAVSAAALPDQLAPLLGYDGIVLSDVPADVLTEAQMRTLQTAVRDAGMGLTAVGGDRAFGAGGYYQTPLEEALPVDMDVRKMRRFPGVALALAVDYSGSMESAPKSGNQGQSKMDLAQEAAHRAVDALSPQDQVGVLAVDTQATTVVPLQFVQNKKDIHAGISGIYGGSGTDMSSGVRAGYAMLENAKARVKHVILITDGETAPFDYKEQIAAYKAKKMTFTLVVIDEGQSPKSVDPLKNVAKATGGRFYFVKDAAQIPKIYTREVQTISKPPILEEPFLPRVQTPGSPAIAGINLGTAPPLLGYDVTVSKPTAEVALSTHKGDPLLATWQYGLGKAAAFTSDAKSRWAAQWLGWPSFGPFWAQTVRWSLRKQEQGSYQSGVEMVNGRGQITVDAVDEKTGQYVNFVDARARVVGPDGSVQMVRLTQTGAGRYVGNFDAAKTGAYAVTMTQKGPDGKTRSGSVGLAVPYSPEFAALGPNTSLLARVADLTGGRVLKDGAPVFDARSVRKLPVPLALPLLGIALLLFPLDVMNRRLMIGNRLMADIKEQAQAKWEAEQEARRAAEAARAAALAASSASVERLRDRKARLQEEEGDGDDAPRRPLPTSATPARSSPPPAVVAGTSTTGGDYGSRLREAKRRAARADDED
jgi:Mg-chelatase subunit ChlD